jgi:hypothetical protein
MNERAAGIHARGDEALGEKDGVLMQEGLQGLCRRSLQE